MENLLEHWDQIMALINMLGLLVISITHRNKK